MVLLPHDLKATTFVDRAVLRHLPLSNIRPGFVPVLEIQDSWPIDLAARL
jgi:hypothetical protein